MSKKTEASQESAERLHVRYIRLPGQVLELYDNLVYKSGKIIVGKSQIASAHSVTFDDEVVLASGFEIVYFDFIAKWFSVGKIRNMQGKHTGYYCDIITPPKLLEDGGVEITDLFLDLWVSPDLRFKVLDEEELENAFHKGWITKRLYERAKRELEKLVKTVNQRKFPSYAINRLEKKLHI